MNAFQLGKDLSVRQIAAIIKKKKLSIKQKWKLRELIWDCIYEMSEEEKRTIDERIKSAEEDPTRLIPWEEVKRIRSTQ